MPRPGLLLVLLLAPLLGSAVPVAPSLRRTHDEAAAVGFYYGAALLLPAGATRRVQEEEGNSTTLPRLVAPAAEVVAVAATASIGLGITALVSARTPTKGTGASTLFLTHEFLDLMTDVAGFFLTSNEGDLEFANDPSGIVAAVLLASVVVSILAFIIEVGLRVWSKDEFRGALPFLQALHFACEDSFQTILYAMVAAAQATTEAGTSGATTFAVLQALAFVAVKMTDMYPSRDASAAGAAAAACCATAAATVVVIVLIATSDGDTATMCDTFECPPGTGSLGLAQAGASCAEDLCVAAECCAAELAGAAALAAEHEAYSDSDEITDNTDDNSAVPWRVDVMISIVIAVACCAGLAYADESTRWALLLDCGVAVQQAGWWSLYSDLGYWCGLIGGAMALAGAVGFDCGPWHAARVPSKEDWRTRPYTDEERLEINRNIREINRRIREHNERGRAKFCSVCCHTDKPELPELPADATKQGEGRVLFWTVLFTYSVCGALATVISADDCPATGTVPLNGDPGAYNNTWVPPAEAWVPPAEAAPDAAGREYGWGDRSDYGGCGAAAGVAGLSLLCLLFVLCIVVEELDAMRRGRR